MAKQREILYAFNGTDAAALLGLIGKSPGRGMRPGETGRARFSRATLVGVETLIPAATISDGDITPGSGEAKLWRLPKMNGETEGVLCEHQDARGNAVEPITLYNLLGEPIHPMLEAAAAPVLAVQDIWGDWWAAEVLVRPARWISFNTTSAIGNTATVEVLAFWDGFDPALFIDPLQVSNTGGRFVGDTAGLTGEAVFDGVEGIYKILQLDCE